MSKRITLILAAALLAVAIGCSSADERLVQVSRESAARQAEQNQEIARQSHEVASATHDLVQANAEARAEFIEAQKSLHEGIQAERGRLDQQRDELEHDRRELVASQQRAPIIADALKGAAILIGCLLPLALAIYVIRSLGTGDPDQAVADLLIEDLLADRPLLLPGPAAQVEGSGRSPKLPSPAPGESDP
jgi:hypothetical protein